MAVSTRLQAALLAMMARRELATEAELRRPQGHRAMAWARDEACVLHRAQSRLGGAAEVATTTRKRKGSERVPGLRMSCKGARQKRASLFPKNGRIGVCGILPETGTRSLTPVSGC